MFAVQCLAAFTLPVSNFGVGIKANGLSVYSGVLLLDIVAVGGTEPSNC